MTQQRSSLKVLEADKAFDESVFQFGQMLEQDNIERNIRVGEKFNFDFFSEKPIQSKEVESNPFSIAWTPSEDPVVPQTRSEVKPVRQLQASMTAKPKMSLLSANASFNLNEDRSSSLFGSSVKSGSTNF